MPGRFAAALPLAVAALRNSPGDLVKGLGWLATLRRSARCIRSVAVIEAVGDDRLERIRYRTADGAGGTVPTGLLLVHEGVVPTIHPTLALGCRHRWDVGQDCFVPELDLWGDIGKPSLLGRSLQGRSVRPIPDVEFGAITRAGLGRTLSPENALRLDLEGVGRPRPGSP